jgi:FkbM family methyltransferase
MEAPSCLSTAYEAETVDAMRHILKPGDCAVDGGACLGFYTLMMAAMVEDSGTIVAFEPGTDNLIRLRQHIASANFHPKVIPQPLWDKCERVTLHISPQSPGCHSLGPFDGKIFYGAVETLELEATTIDTWNIEPKLIKLDIEGAEINALMGATRTILKHRPYLVCEINNTTLSRFSKTDKDLRSFVKETFGYETFVLQGKGMYPTLLPEGVEIVTQYMNLNALFATIEMIAKAFPVISYA